MYRSKKNVSRLSKGYQNTSHTHTHKLLILGDILTEICLTLNRIHMHSVYSVSNCFFFLKIKH